MAIIPLRSGGSATKSPGIIPLRKAAAPAAAKEPKKVASYFDNSDLGASNVEDSAGKPFLTFKDYAARKSVLDTTRVATTFDPRTRQVLDATQTSNPRDDKFESAERKRRGGTDTQQLDHIIPLSLSGSNAGKNLNLVENEGGKTNQEHGRQPLVDLEWQLARDVKARKLSLFEAQAQLAKAKKEGYGVTQKYPEVPNRSVVGAPRASLGGREATPELAARMRAEETVNRSVVPPKPGILERLRSGISDVASLVTDRLPFSETRDMKDAKARVTERYGLNDAARSVIDGTFLEDKGAKARIGNPFAPKLSEGEGGGGTTGKKTISIAAGQPDQVVAHELFHRLYGEANVDPAAFNASWPQALAKLQAKAEQEERTGARFRGKYAGPASFLLASMNGADATIGKDGLYRGITPAVQANERYAHLGQELTKDVADALPEELRRFYAPYLEKSAPSAPAGKGAGQTVKDYLAKGPRQLAADAFKAIGGESVTHPIATFKELADQVGQSADVPLKRIAASVKAIGENMKAKKDGKPVPDAKALSDLAGLALAGAQLGLASVSDTFAIGEKLPVFAPAFKAVGLVFDAAGKVTGYVADKALESVPDSVMSKEDKATLAPVIHEAGTLAGQIYLGARALHRIAGITDAKGRVTPEDTARLATELREEAGNLPQDGNGVQARAQALLDRADTMTPADFKREAAGLQEKPRIIPFERSAKPGIEGKQKFVGPGKERVTITVKDEAAGPRVDPDLKDEVVEGKGKGGTTLTVDEQSKVPEPKTAYDQVKDRLAERLKEIRARRYADEAQRQSTVKGESMEHSAMLRKMRGEPTAIEIANATKYLDGARVGKEVTVEGTKGVVDSLPSFGRVKVRMEDGSTRSVPVSELGQGSATRAEAVEYLKKQGEKEALGRIKTFDPGFKVNESGTQPIETGRPVEKGPEAGPIEATKGYHATPEKNAESIATEGVRNTVGSSGDGYYFSENRAMAENYVTRRVGRRGEKPAVFEVGISPDAKLFDLESAKASKSPADTAIVKLIKELREEGKIARPDASNNRIKDALLAAGYDGIKAYGDIAIYDKGKFEMKGKTHGAAEEARRIDERILREDAAKSRESVTTRTADRPEQTIEEKRAVTPKKASKIAKSIEAKAVEAKLTEGFKDVAGYDTITWKEQSKRATELVTADIEDVRAIVRGEKELPSDLRGISLVTAMEEHIKANPGPDTAELTYELANSPLVSGTSYAAQELGLAAARSPDSAAARLQEVRKAREAATGRKDLDKQRSAARKELKAETKKVNLDKAELSWDRFLSALEC